jgi:predicted N-acetyltransferase YhbS
MNMSETIMIRIAGPGDVATIWALVESAYRGDTARQGWTHEADLLDGQRTDPQAIADILADDRNRLLVATSAGTPIGCVQITRRDKGFGYLGMLAVDPTRQAAGLGRMLIASAEDHARRLFGAVVIEMTVIRQRIDLVAYYERRGYRKTGEERPFPYGDPRAGQPRIQELAFVVLAKRLHEDDPDASVRRSEAISAS